ncbi:prolyl oligopeptidase family serine peptidase [Streptomyces sp. NPDC052396]|uniref:S9 family peptidase n=1 Tax=Streptomyces sp. NPDC052396 TaxID=3365689 RepID=UPI0037D207C6
MMPDSGKTPVPYGSWPSPISAESVSEGLPMMSGLQLDGPDVLWLQSCPDTGRTMALRRTAEGATTPVTGSGTDIRSLVHEYGGGALHAQGGALYYVSGADQRVHRKDGHGDVPLTPGGGPPGAQRFADLRLLPGTGRLVCVRERHIGGEVRHDIVRLDGSPQQPPSVLVSGHDFYAAPRPSPDGTTLAWLAWNQPEMPWTGSELWLGQLAEDGSVARARRVAGGPGESVFQPEWSPEGILHFVTDRTGWWNPHRLTEDGIEPVARLRAEFAWPQWTLDPSAYCFLSRGRIACLYIRGGTQRLGIIDPATGRVRDSGLPYTAYQAIAGAGDDLYALAAAPDRPQRLIRVDPQDFRHEVLHVPGRSLGPEWIRPPELLDLTAPAGHAIHGIFHPPAHPELTGPAGKPPPLILICHGGPTAQALPDYRPGIRFWTSRGFAVLELNGRGSSGWGRDYRAALDGQWGLADVSDCVEAARLLAAMGKADPARMVVRGGSAGGFTVLAALAASDVFAAGISYFGLGDLRLLRLNTHKFEEGSLDLLIGPWPEAEAEYRRRSPVERCEAISAPVLFLHGRRDTVVPVEQSALMAERLRARGVPCRTVFFDDEGHGFGKRANIVSALESELEFVREVLALSQAGGSRPDTRLVVECGDSP